MTLQPYTPERLDDFALRLLDVAGQLRSMACRGRAEGLTEMPLHDNKALEWLARLEDWVQKTNGEFERTVARHRGARRAEAATRASS